MFAKLRALRKDQNGAATLEFVAVFFAFVAVLMFVIETAVYLFFMASVEKAAEAGVRMAVVSWPVRDDNLIQRTIRVNGPGGDSGQSCDTSAGSNNPCIPFGPYQCGRGTGRNCGRGTTSNLRAQQSFDRIIAEMRRYNANITRTNVTVVYSDAGIGFAGGPRIPMVTVTVDGLGMQTGMFGLLLGDAASGLGLLPARSASMTGESLGQ